jgi:hypothetical protein
VNDLGDFQTPKALVDQILNLLAKRNRHWSRIFEPTCGVGNFIQGAICHPHFAHAEIRGVEIQAEHVKHAKTMLTAANHEAVSRARLLNEDIFTLNLSTDLHWQGDGPLLVIGNPPWVTNSALGSMESLNLPTKTNFKNLLGFEALTGQSNFDIAEYIWLKLIWELADQAPTIALLCKTTVAQNILKYAYETQLPIENALLWKIDAKQWFGVAVSACLFYVEIGHRSGDYTAPIMADITDTADIETVMGMVDGKWIADIQTWQTISALDGHCLLNWRQGLKHDAASVMELTAQDGRWVNKLGEVVEVEAEFVYPLLKGSDIYHGRVFNHHRAVIVTQTRLDKDTLDLARQAPQLWTYLQRHATIFAKRKSSIYQNRPPFSMFGIGDYSFAPYKVAVSGLHHAPEFRLIAPLQNCPVMVDDTCYFLPCTTLGQAALLTALLRHPISINFYKAISFADAKRPISKKVLQRLNLALVLEKIGKENALSTAKELLATDRDIVESIDWDKCLAEVFLAYSSTPRLF